MVAGGKPKPCDTGDEHAPRCAVRSVEAKTARFEAWGTVGSRVCVCECQGRTEPKKGLFSHIRNMPLFGGGLECGGSKACQVRHARSQLSLRYKAIALRHAQERVRHPPPRVLGQMCISQNILRNMP